MHVACLSPSTYLRDGARVVCRALALGFLSLFFCGGNVSTEAKLSVPQASGVVKRKKKKEKKNEKKKEKKKEKGKEAKENEAADETPEAIAPHPPLVQAVPRDDFVRGCRAQ
ncbi:UNVERIFIED_CONTAM: hypothetical protein HHA_454600 [Hammondia hammondi]|eukprot:XP_008888190.1 hypothetical protein HHA_454600 [Hammondia hammondi]